MTLADTIIQVSTLPELHLCLSLHNFTINPAWSLPLCHPCQCSIKKNSLDSCTYLSQHTLGGVHFYSMLDLYNNSRKTLKQELLSTLNRWGNWSEFPEIHCDAGTWGFWFRVLLAQLSVFSQSSKGNNEYSFPSCSQYRSESRALCC